jgi:DNA-binding CsgD family transcriptional regulator
MKPWNDVALRLQKIFRQPNKTPSPHPVPIRSDLFLAVTEIAAQDESSVDVVVNDLLSFALAERQSSHASLEIWYQLTQREREVAVLVWFGLTNKEIAERMVISIHTVKAHMRNILAKLSVHSKEELRQALTGLDFSEWADLWADPVPPPRNGE